MTAKVKVWAIRVDVAEPAIPIFGKGPIPMISMGFKMTSSPTAKSEK